MKAKSYQTHPLGTFINKIIFLLSDWGELCCVLVSLPRLPQKMSKFDIKILSRDLNFFYSSCLPCTNLDKDPRLKNFQFLKRDLNHTIYYYYTSSKTIHQCDFHPKAVGWDLAILFTFIYFLGIILQPTSC